MKYYFVYKNDCGLQMISYEGSENQEHPRTPGEAIDKYKADLYKKWFKENNEVEEFRRNYFRKNK